MTEDQLANIITVFAVVLGMAIALVVGYAAGYEDAMKHFKDKNERTL